MKISALFHLVSCFIKNLKLQTKYNFIILSHYNSFKYYLNYSITEDVYIMRGNYL